VRAGLLARLDADPSVARHRRALAAEVAAGRLGPDAAAEALIDALLPRRPPPPREP
jgi:hypothetical protein